MNLEPGEIINGHELLERIGSGSTTVWKVRETTKGDIRVLKVLDALPSGKLPKHLHAFIEALSKIRHPCIARIYAIGQLPSRLNWMIMDYMPGSKLKDLKFSVAEAMSLLVGLIDALMVLNKSFPITELSPGDLVVLNVEGEQRLCFVDHSTFRYVSVSAGSSDCRNLSPNVDVSTWSPQSLMGKKTDERALVYSIGCLLYYMCMGRPLFTGKNVFELASKHMHVQPELTGLDSDAVPVVRKCLGKEPEQRYSSLADLKQALLGVASGAEVIPDQPAAEAFPGVRVSNSLHRGLLLALLGIGVVVSGVIIFTANKSKEPESTVVAPVESSAESPQVVPLPEPDPDGSGNEPRELVGQARARLAAGNKKEALRLCRAALEKVDCRKPSEDTVLTLLEINRLLIEMDNYALSSSCAASALDCARQLGAKSPVYNRALIAAMESQRAAGELEAAQKMVSMLPKNLGKLSCVVLRDRAEMYEQVGRWQQARDLIQAGLEDTNDADSKRFLKLNLARLLSRHDELSAAAKVLQDYGGLPDVKKADQLDAEILYEWIRIKILQGDYKSANISDLFEHLAPDETPAGKRLYWKCAELQALIRYGQKNYQQARKMLESLTHKLPADDTTGLLARLDLIRLAQAQDRQQDVDGFLSRMELEQDLTDRQRYYYFMTRAKVMMARNELEKADKAIDEAAAADGKARPYDRLETSACIKQKIKVLELMKSPMLDAVSSRHTMALDGSALVDLGDLVIAVPPKK